MDIISKIEKVKLLGRSGSEFPVSLKWQALKENKAKKKYIICNASEGEPGLFKDRYILENYGDEFLEGIKIALYTFKNSYCYIYLNKDYLFLKKALLKKAKGLLLEIILKPEGYIAGEETALMNFIEGKGIEPRIKPPFPTEKGLFGFPTLVNNVETFYYISKINNNQYDGSRFYSLSGDIKKGVYQFPYNLTIKKILEKTNSWPDFDFFVQSGGGAYGEILLKEELNKRVQGAGSIIVYNKNTDIFSLMKKWIDFLLVGNCDKCTPCREGLLRIEEMINNRKIDQKIIKDIFFVMEKTSFCPLGKISPRPFKTLINKLYDSDYK